MKPKHYARLFFVRFIVCMMEDDESFVCVNNAKLSNYLPELFLLPSIFALPPYCAEIYRLRIHLLYFTLK